MAFDGFAPEDITSYYQTRVARVFVQSALDNVVKSEDPDLLPDLQIIADHLLEPVQDTGSLSHDELQDPVLLQRIYDIEQAQKARRQQAFDHVVQKYIDRPEKLSRVVEHVTRIGHLIKSASAHSHDNTMDDLRDSRDEAFAEIGPDGVIDQKKLIPESLERYFLDIIQKGHVKTGEEFRAAIAAAVVSSVSTSHPTRYLIPDYTNNRLMFLLSGREMTRHAGETQHLLAEFANGRGQTFETMRRWWSTDITYTDSNGGPANMTPLQEVMAGVNDFADDFARNIDEIYRTYDDALTRLDKAGLLPWKYDEKEQRLLELSLRFATWIMGDKDGNNNIRSEHLMLAVLAFRNKTAELIAAQLQGNKIVIPRTPDDNSTAADWGTYFAEKQREMDAIQEKLLRIVHGRGKNIDLPLSHKDFEGVLEQMRGVYGDIDAMQARFQEDLGAACAQAEPEHRKALLSLDRKMRIFGIGGMKFHLRETADVYQPIVATLLKEKTGLFSSEVDYENLEESRKIHVLRRAFEKEKESPGSLAKLKDSFFARVEPGGKSRKSVANLRNYSKDNPDVITAHTLQRYEVGSLQKGLISDHVLAECNGARQMLETLLLSKITGVQFNIVPLLEEHETLTQAIPIFKAAFNERAWRDHMWEMSGGDVTKIINLLKIQFAHSDNMRRMGKSGALANIIDQANLLLPGGKELFEFMLEKYAEDGRISRRNFQNYRDVMDKRPNAYCIQQFHGGSRCDTARGGTYPTTATVDDFNTHEYTEGTDQGSDNTELRLGERFKRLLTTLVARNATIMLKKNNGEGKVWDFDREGKIRAAIDRSIDDYIGNHYGPDNQLGIAMGEAGLYWLNHVYNNPGSRGGREESGGVKPVELSVDPVDPTDMRTIGFTTTINDAGINPGILPMRNMGKYINELYHRDPDLLKELQKAADDNDGSGKPVFVVTESGVQLNELGLKTLARISRTYRAAACDFPAYAAAISDPKLSLDLLMQREERGGPKVSQATLDYFTTSIPKDYVGSTVNFLKARGFEIPAGFIKDEELQNPTLDTCSKLCTLTRKLVMTSVDEQIGLGERIHHFGRVVKEGLLNHTWKTKPEGERFFDNAQAYVFRLAAILRNVHVNVIHDGMTDNSVGKHRVATRSREHYQAAQEFRLAA